MHPDTAAVPPYGTMWRDFERHAKDLSDAPGNWPGGSAAYTAWVNATIDILAAAFWPRYAGGWTGNTSNMLPLSDLELRLMDRFQGLHFQEPVLAGLSPTHAELFRDEDEGEFFQSAATYCPALLPLRRTLVPLMESASDRMHVMDLHLKYPFQRPRPYQMARLLGRDLRHEYALWAFTPSLISAHALEGAVACAMVYEWLLAEHPAEAVRLKGGLQQCAMDIGDRRVMAGVHYPSDGAASYVALLSAVGHIFPEPEIARFLVEAVRTQSKSFKLMEGIVGDGGADGQVLAAPWKALREALEGAASSAKSGAVRPGDERGTAPPRDPSYSMAKVRREHQRRSLARREG